MTDTPKTEISFKDAYDLVGKPRADTFAPLVITGAALGAVAILGNAYRISGRIIPVIDLPFAATLAGAGGIIGGILSMEWQERETRRRMATEHPELTVGAFKGGLR
jgi:hypothetical protein